jgi:transposase
MESVSHWQSGTTRWLIVSLSFSTQHHEEILNFFVNRSTNASAESFNAKIKAFRASLRGVVDIKFFLLD